MKDDEAEIHDLNDVSHLPVIAIGASAGGLEALTEMLAQARPGGPAAFVVIQHLAPDQKSILHELLQTHCQVPVTQIVQDEVIERGHVYVVPPGKQAELQDGTLHLSDREQTDNVFRPIDHFFDSLAHNVGRHAYCVVLSGTGSDGSEGLRNIKSSGGFAVAQEAENARFPGMPDAAISTGLVDFILPAREIIPRLTAIIHHRGEVEGVDARERLAESIKDVLPQIFEKLRDVTGHDFSDYKPGTVLRRIERRMTLMRIMDVDAFLKVIKADEKEANLLAQDFLIGVTQFFRDPDAFEELRKKVVDPILKGDPDHIRIWVPGCSTGEEVYSLAILFHEALENAKSRCTLQVFGTDIDSHALVAARNGVYTASAVKALSKDHLTRYFTPESGSYKANAALREACVFAPHNLVQDPPFSRLDLISCRNVMIYLSSQLQQRVLPRFHFSLKPGGYLFLGPSEGLAGEDRLFKTVNKAHRIFRRNDDADTIYSSLSEVVPRAGQTRRIAGVGAPPVPMEAPRAATREVMAQQAFLARHASPFAVISDNGEVRYVSHAMTGFARPSEGVPSNQIDSFLSSELRVPVRSALSEVQETGKEVTVPGVLVAADGDRPRMYDFSLSPMEGSDDEYLLVLTEVRATDTEAIGDAIDLRETMDREILVGENARLRRQLTEVLQEFDTSGQELKSTNEELMSMNEELQSSNEELETSREELQSINEELETVNSELRENNRRLTRANSDLKNLFESTDIAVMFLDRSFVLRNYTPATTALYGVKDRDIGRPIFDLHSRIDYPDLRADAERVDATLQPVEHEVRIEETDETFLMRIKPYRTTDDRIDGYVLSFVDITLRKRNEMVLERNREELAQQYAELENLYDTTPVGLCLVDRDFRFLRVNAALADVNGLTVEDNIGKTFDEVLPDISETVKAPYAKVFETGEPLLGVEIEGVVPSSPGVTRNWICDFYPIRDGDTVFAVGGCVQEVTEQKRLMAQIEESEGRIRRLFDAAPVFIAITEGPDHVYTYSNPAHDAICGHRELVGKSILEALPELEGQGIVERFDEVLRTGETKDIPVFKATFDRNNDGKWEEGWFKQTLEPIRDGNGRTMGVATFAYEVTEERRLLMQLEDSEARMKRLFDNAPLYILTTTGPDHEVTYQNPLIDAVTGPGGLLGKPIREGMPEFAEQGLIDDWDKVYETGETVAIAEIRATAINKQTGEPVEGWYSQRLEPIKDADGTTVGVASFGYDITDTVEARENAQASEQQKTLLLGELQHRVKNTLATIRAISRLLLPGAQDAESYQSRLSDRLSAMARTHDLLFGQNVASASMESLIKAEAAPYETKDTPRIVLSGDECHLSAEEATSMGMALHELMTNAAKHGALSVPEGRIHIHCTEDAKNGTHTMIWTETDGPPVENPGEQKGFGSIVIGQVLASNLDAEVDIDFRAEGLVATVVWEHSKQEA